MSSIPRHDGQGSRSGRARRAFTLIELIVVVAIMGLMFGMVFFRLDGMLPSRRLAADARALASQLEFARNIAVVSGYQVAVQYDLDAGAYRVYHPFELSPDGGGIVGEGETELFPWRDLSDSILFHDVVLGEGDPAESGQIVVTFEPRGIATGHSVHLMKEESDFYYTVLVSPLLGYVDVEKGFTQPEVLPDER